MQKKKRVSKKNQWIRLGVIIGSTILILFAIYGITILLFPGRNTSATKDADVSNANKKSVASEITPTEAPDWVTKNFLTPNEYSRAQEPLKQINGTVVHYVANPGTTAEQNRNYFENLGTTGETKASSHFIIGIDGTIIQCMPLNEIAYCSNERNADTISIECCHPGEDGQFSDATYQSLVKLVNWLSDTYDFNSKTDVIRHYDVTGKECPKYYVDHQDAWDQFIQTLN